MAAIEIQVWNKVTALGRWEELLPAWYRYWKDEPMASAFTENWKDRNNLENLQHYLLVTVSLVQVPIVVAWDKESERVAGFCMSRIDHSQKLLQEHPELALTALSEFKDYGFDSDTKAKLNAVWSFCGEMGKAADVFNKLKTDKIFWLEYGSVLPEYRGKGVITRLTKTALKLARENFSFAASAAASAYSKKLFLNSLGFENVLERRYEGNYPLFMAMPEKIRSSHPTISVVVKSLL